MKRLILLAVIIISLLQGCKLRTYTLVDNYQYIQNQKQHQRQVDNKWKLVWKDDFNGNSLDTTKWTKVPAGKSAWNKHMSYDPSCYALLNGLLHLKGIPNPDTSLDKRPFITGGIYSKGKFAFQYGKIEIRAKLGAAKGAWPAMWMLAATNKHGAYPRNGEIDIMEHLNYDSIIYQTIHSYYTLNLKQDKHPPHFGTAKFNTNDFNVFGLKRYPDSILYSVNGKRTFTYPRVKGVDSSQWPFDQPFYVLIDQQLGGDWVGEVQPADLPVEMVVDWVKVYQ